MKKPVFITDSRGNVHAVNPEFVTQIHLTGAVIDGNNIVGVDLAGGATILLGGMGPGRAAIEKTLEILETASS